MTKPEKAKRHDFFIVNIKLRNKTSKQDLSKEAYEKLFRRLWRKKVHKESSTQKHCIIKSYREEVENGEILFFSGLLAQFTYIENESWFNLEALEEVEDFQLPDNLFPDLVLTEYVFVPAAHRFAFLTNSTISISPYPVKKYLEKALDEVALPNEIIHVDVETSKDGMQQIRKAIEVRRLKVTVSYSNLDFGSDIQKFFEDNLRDSNTERITIDAKAKKDSSIDIGQSPILEGALSAAQSDGEAEAKIVDENGTLKKVKTEDYPRKESIFGVSNRFPILVYESIMNIFRPRQNEQRRKG